MFSDHLLIKKGQVFFLDITQLHHYYSHGIPDRNITSFTTLTISLQSTMM